MIEFRIENKGIIIWGIEILQSDLEGIYDFPDFLYYVDHDIQEKNIISAREDQVYAPNKLLGETVSKVFVIICTEDQEEAIGRLESMGYGESDYILGAELLLCKTYYKQIRNKEISIWGTGTTYLLYEAKIRQYFPNVIRFIVTEKKCNRFQDKELVSLEELKDGELKSYIIVTSIYYKEIYKNLINIGMCPGKDFIHIDTLLTLCSMSGGIDEGCQFMDCKRDEENLLVVLAGYKEFVWESVFGRLKAFVPKKTDVCVVTSGLVNDDLKNMCKKNHWSYLSISRNNVSMAVNSAIWEHPKAKFIYKMDEDIFLTEGTFEILKHTYLKIKKNDRYEIGFVTPLIPINGYGYVRLLEIFGAVDLWKEKFGELKYANLTHHKKIYKCSEAARFMWGEGNPAMGSLDRMHTILSHGEFQYSVCSMRYSIGFILFHRNNWIRMGGFPTVVGNMGMDEEELCRFCMLRSYAMVVSENAVVGHLAYGDQNKAMEQYYYENKKKFLLSLEAE